MEKEKNKKTSEDEKNDTMQSDDTRSLHTLINQDLGNKKVMSPTDAPNKSLTHFNPVLLELSGKNTHINKSRAALIKVERLEVPQSIESTFDEKTKTVIAKSLDQHQSSKEGLYLHSQSHLQSSKETLLKSRPNIDTIISSENL